ncbi:hypothetical protein [Microbacterium sp. NPDC056234]|uniref:hypothetical protein n=1 Tax=Microbacterium sp. NPDC056234 TaxID=3345757 RepID=UPI0035D648BF
MKRATPWLITAALLVGAWLVALVTPDDSASVEPFIVPVTIDEAAAGRDFTVTVRDVTLADKVSGSGGWSAEGTWLVVELDAEANVDQFGMSFRGATLIIDDQSFRASERTESFLSTQLVTGVSQSGALAFELPEDARERTGVLQLSANADTRADSVAELEIDLSALTPVADAEVRETEWTHP